MKLSVDNKQRLQTASQFVLEFYKIMMATLLGIFVPQECDGGLCTYSENANNHHALHVVMNASNLITFLSVAAFYIIELKRENWSITYLDIDKNKPNSNLDHEIERYPKIKKKLHSINQKYLYSIYISLGLMAFNFIISAIAIGLTNPNSQTAAAFVSFFLLVIGKLTGAKSLAEKSMRKERVYSGYLKTSRTYNTIDADHAVEFKEVTDEETGEGQNDPSGEERETVSENDIVTEESPSKAEDTTESASSSTQSSEKNIDVARTGHELNFIV